MFLREMVRKCKKRDRTVGAGHRGLPPTGMRLCGNPPPKAHHTSRRSHIRKASVPFDSV
jgi:hypothetical protein